MKKVYLVWTGTAKTMNYDYVDEVFSNKREAEKYKKNQSDYWNEMWKTGQCETHWIFWIQPKELRSKAILKGSQE